MNVLIACEESQIECIEFRKNGFTAYSSDLQKCSGGHPEWHFCGDVLKILYPPIEFTVESGEVIYIDHWDLVIAHPPCTYFCRPQAKYLLPTSKYFRPDRYLKMLEARDFFMKFYELECPYAIENPVPLSYCDLPRHSCCANPYEFGDPYSKLTYYWLHRLPPLWPTCVLGYHEQWVGGRVTGCAKSNSRSRSKSFPGISRAMADQWGDYIKKHCKE